jgi:hypothetical protein
MIELLPCPFCGSEIDPTDPDAIYPSGIWWRGRGEYRQYIGNKSRQPDDNACFNIVCPGGCGCVLSGDSKQEVIDRWNIRVTIHA